MFGLKLIEFDNSDGTIKSFNKIFPNTPLTGDGHVEILEITEFNKGNLYIRDISVDGKVFAFDFGQKNFVNPAYFMEEKVRFKYVVENLEEKVIAVAYNIKDLSKKIGYSESVIKNILSNSMPNELRVRYNFNIKRTDLWNIFVILIFINFCFL